MNWRCGEKNENLGIEKHEEGDKGKYYNLHIFRLNINLFLKFFYLKNSRSFNHFHEGYVLVLFRQ